MKKLQLSVVSPEKRLFDGEVSIVRLPGMAGAFSVLPGHASIVSSLAAGVISYDTPEGARHRLSVKGGFVELSGGVLSVCIVPSGEEK